MLRMEREDPFVPLQCSSGCESGWTMYLEQSFGEPSSLPPKNVSFRCKNGGFAVEESAFVDEEEDLSMVSDASSGPPHFHEDDEYSDENGCFCSAASDALLKKNDKRTEVEAEVVEDDTASSHVFSFSKSSFSLSNSQASMEDDLDISMGFSTTHFKAKPVLQKRYYSDQTSQPLKPISAKRVD